jgi:hypothetical protein
VRRSKRLLTRLANRDLRTEGTSYTAGEIEAAVLESARLTQAAVRSQRPRSSVSGDRRRRMTAEPRVWCAMIYVADSRDVAGAVRRSKRLHWKQEDARRELDGW